MKIAFIDYVLEPDKPGRSGLSDIVWDMASELVNQGHEAHVIASYHANSYPDERVIVHNFPTPPIGYRNAVGHFWLLKRAATIAKKLQPDIIHAPEYVSTAALASYGVKTPLVLTVPGNIFHRIKEGNPYEWYYTQILKWAARTSAKRCSKIIAISQEMQKWWEWTGAQPEHIIWIPLGVNTNRFSPVPKARVKLGISDEKLFLLYVGRFSREKGLLDLLDALVYIKPYLNPEKIQITLVGKGPLGNELERRIKSEKLEQVVFIRQWVAQDELSFWYSSADALLLPSHTEAFSRTIPEAMSCGSPIVGTKITGTEDHVKSGLNGYLVPPKDPKALADVLYQLIQAPYRIRRMRESAYKYTIEHLTWGRVVSHIVEEVYRPVIAEAFNNRGNAYRKQSREQIP